MKAQKPEEKPKKKKDKKDKSRQTVNIDPKLHTDLKVMAAVDGNKTLEAKLDEVLRAGIAAIAATA